MDIEQVLKLIDAGFTAEEIRKMIPQKTEVSPVLSPEPEAATISPAAAAPAPEVKEEKKEEPKPDPLEGVKALVEEPKPDLLEGVKALVVETIANVMKSYQDQMAKVMKMAGMPSLGDVEPKGIENIVSNFFKEE